MPVPEDRDVIHNYNLHFREDEYVEVWVTDNYGAAEIMVVHKTHHGLTKLNEGLSDIRFTARRRAEQRHVGPVGPRQYTDVTSRDTGISE